MKVLSDDDSSRITTIEEKYNRVIKIEDCILLELQKRIDALNAVMKIHSSKKKDYRSKMFREIQSVKNKERESVFRGVDVGIGSKFEFKFSDEYHGLTLGSNTLYCDVVTLGHLEIVGETPTQYRILITCDERFDLVNTNRYNNFRSTKLVRTNLGKLNLKEFLKNYSTSFKRECNISNLIS